MLSRRAPRRADSRLDLTFDLEVFVSPGNYICGEESALLEAIEGKRAEPRNKPPFPALQGLWQKPTVINNVETFAFATAILARGADWYKAQGVNGSSGSKFIGVSGHVRAPGVFEIPMGITYRQLIHDYAGGPRFPGTRSRRSRRRGRRAATCRPRRSTCRSTGRR